MQDANRLHTVIEEVGNHRWEVELREHAHAEWRRAQGMPTIVIVIRVDGEMLCSVYPTQIGGIGVQVASTILDFEDVLTLSGGAGAFAPALIIHRREGGEGNGTSTH